MAETTRAGTGGVGATVRDLNVRAETGKLVEEKVVAAALDPAAASQADHQRQAEAQANRPRQNWTVALHQQEVKSHEEQNPQKERKSQQVLPACDAGLVSRRTTNSAMENK